MDIDRARQYAPILASNIETGRPLDATDAEIVRTLLSRAEELEGLILEWHKKPTGDIARAVDAEAERLLAGKEKG